MSEVELEWHLIYAIVVAGKSARFANVVIARLKEIHLARGEGSPINHLVAHPEDLRAANAGRYGILEKAFLEFSRRQPELRTCHPRELERIPGIGPKTSRFFVVWTRPEARFAVLDRHVLRWMNARPPKTVREYEELEREFLEEADRRGQTPRELDLEIWRKAATAPNVV